MRRRVRDLVATLFVLVGLGLVVLAYVWFSGRLGVKSVTEYRVRFGDVSGLRTGDPVEVLGIHAGRVSRLDLDGDSVLVVLALSREVKLSSDTRFVIRSVSYLGSDRYVLVMPGCGPQVVSSQEFVGENEALSLETTIAKLDNVLTQLDLTTLTGELHQTMDEFIEAVRQALPALNSGAVQIVEEMKRVSGSIDSLTRMFYTESTARKLLTSDSLYNELRNTNLQLQTLLRDMQERPERYFRLRLGR